jgi:hypothetical protein
MRRFSGVLLIILASFLLLTFIIAGISWLSNPAQLNSFFDPTTFIAFLVTGIVLMVIGIRRYNNDYSGTNLPAGQPTEPSNTPAAFNSTEQFKNAPGRFNEVKKQIIIRTLPVGIVGVSIGKFLYSLDFILQ